MASDCGIGARLPRLEDARFLEGRSQFCADIALPGTLHAAFVRSPHAHARILAVRKPQGLEDRIYLAGDLTGVGKMRSTAKLPGFKPSDWPILAACCRLTIVPVWAASCQPRVADIGESELIGKPRFTRCEPGDPYRKNERTFRKIPRPEYEVQN